MSDLRVITFDPSIDKMGIVVLDFTYSPFKVVEVYRSTTNGAKLERLRKYMLDRFSKSYCKLDALEEIIDNLFEEYKPDEAATESAFSYNRPAVVISLTYVIGLLRRKVHKFLDKDIHTVAPVQTKRAVTGNKDASKDQMREWYDKCDYIVKLPGTASEHEIDATAHGITYVLRDVLKTYVPELTAKEKKKLKKLKVLEKG